MILCSLERRLARITLRLAWSSVWTMFALLLSALCDCAREVRDGLRRHCQVQTYCQPGAEPNDALQLLNTFSVAPGFHFSVDSVDNARPCGPRQRVIVRQEGREASCRVPS
jgi:hypothetical protein